MQWKTLAALCSLAVASGDLGCSGDSDPASEATADLWAAKQTRWPADAMGNVNISVCWETPGFAARKAQVREVVATTWSAATRVTFHGWKDCGGEPADLRIRVADEVPHVATVDGEARFGRRLRGVPGGLTMNLIFEEFFPLAGCLHESPPMHTCIRATTLHEFGHVLGFLHEQDRPDAPDPLNCAQTDTDVGIGLKLGKYDPDSIMNACHDLLAHPRLSAGDIAGAQRWYGSPIDSADAGR